MANFPRDFIAIAEERDRLRQDLKQKDAEIARLRQYEPLKGGVPLREFMLLRQLDAIRQASLTWAMTCPHDCPACDAMYEAIKGAEHPSGMPVVPEQTELDTDAKRALYANATKLYRR